VNQKTSLSPVMAIRIAEATNTTAESWMNMQLKYDLWKVMQNKPENIKKFDNIEISRI
jgi:antitoxin HigA-1